MLEMMNIKPAVLRTESALLEGNCINNKTSVKKCHEKDKILSRIWITSGNLHDRNITILQPPL